MSAPVAAVLVALFTVAAAAPARAVTVPAQSVFDFSGTCSDCAGTATGELVLQNYTLGAAIDDTNFVSFSYRGTNMFPAYTITATQAPGLSGSIASDLLPGAQTVDISTDSLQFSSDQGGFWCTGAAYSCSFDMGSTHLWSAVAAAPTVTVPEPISIALLGGGLLGVAALRRRTS